jgi:hypothetical protein
MSHWKNTSPPVKLVSGKSQCPRSTPNPRLRNSLNRETRETREKSRPFLGKLSGFAYFAYFAVRSVFYIGAMIKIKKPKKVTRTRPPGAGAMFGDVRRCAGIPYTRKRIFPLD